MSSGVTDQTRAKSVEAWEPVYIWCRPLCPQQLECGFLCTRSSSHPTPPGGQNSGLLLVSSGMGGARRILRWGSAPWAA